MDNSPGYGIYIISSGQQLRLPVLPDEVSVTYDGDNTQYNVIGIGEVVIPRHNKLATVTIDSFFPRNMYTSATCVSAWYAPEYYVNYIRNLQQSQAVVQLIINRYDNTELMFNTSFLCVISTFTVIDKGGESGDIYYSLSLQEYRDIQPQLVTSAGTVDNGATQQLVIMPSRPVSSDVIVPGDRVEVSGKIYPTDNISDGVNIQSVSRQQGIVQRTLPTSAPRRLYIIGLGWTDIISCSKTPRRL